jgi:hypothetical protein
VSVRFWPILVSLVVWAQGAAAFDWPVAEPVVTATFAESRGDHLHGGVDLGGGEQPVFPIAAGELVFFHEEGGYSSLPVGLGSFVVLQHEGGIRSLYAHLKEGSIDGTLKRYDRGRPLGTVGSSGYSQGTHLHLGIIDAETQTIVNPFLLLPPVRDMRRPTIREVFLREGQSVLRVADGMVARRGQQEVLVSAFDVRDDVSFLWRLAPYKISLYQDGREIFAFQAETLHAAAAEAPGVGTAPPGGDAAGAAPTGSEVPLRERRLVLRTPERSFEELYAGEWLYRLGTLKLAPGETILTIIAADFAGNETSVEYTLKVSD